MNNNLVRLGDITNNLDNRRIPLNETQRSEIRGEGKYPYWGANNEVDRVDKYIFDEKILCVAEDGGSWGAGETCAYIVNEKCWVNNHAHVLTAKPSAHLEYIKYFFNCADLSAYITGTTRGKLTRTHLDSIMLPLPPLAEQKRLAAILDEADALRRKRRETLARLDALLQSVFLDMFGDPVTNTKGWEMCPFEQVTKSQLGKMLDEKRQTHLPQRKYLRNANVRWGEFDLTDVFEMGIADDERERFTVLPGDLLVCEGGEPGRAAIWNGAIAECYFQKALHRIRVNTSICTSEYILYLLWRLSKSGGLSDSISLVTIAHLTGEKLKKLMIPVPPFRLQEEFASRVTTINAMQEQQQASLNQLERLFTSLQQQAFSSETTETNTTEMPNPPCLTFNF